MTLLLDAGAFLVLERAPQSRRAQEVMASIAGEHREERAPRTHGGVVAQVWRGGHGRQAHLARVLAGVAVAPLNRELGKRAGILLRESSRGDAVDAALVALAHDGDVILTSDLADLRALAEAADVHVDVVSV